MQCIKCKKPIPDGAAFCPSCGAKQAPSERTQKTKSRGNGQGSVYKRDKGWQAAYTYGWKDGKALRITKSGFKTKTEALAYIPILMEDAKGNRAKTKPVSFKQLYDDFIPYYTPRIGATTLKTMKSAANWFTDIYSVLITELTIDDLQDCLDSCPRGKSTRENMKYLATQMYKYAEARLMISKNIAAFLYCDGVEATRPAFTATEIQKIKNAIGAEYGADYVYCLIYTGFRPNEMLNLTRFNYNPEERILTGGFKTEAGTNRPVPVSPKILPIIERLYAKADPWLFTDQNGHKLNDATFRLNIFYPLLAKLGIQPIPDQDHPARLVPYSCRHTFANFLKSATGPDKDKAALMGHTDIGMTKKYQSADLDTLRSIIQSI